MSKTPFKFSYDSPGELSLSSAVKQVLGWASDEDGDYSIKVLQDALLEFLNSKQNEINTRHEQEISVLKGQLNDETTRLRGIISDRRNRIKNLLDLHWPGSFTDGEGDLAAIATLERHVARLVEQNNRDFFGEQKPTVRVVGVDPGWPGGFTILSMTVCDNCHGSGRVPVPGVVAVAGGPSYPTENCSRCGGSGRLLSPIPDPPAEWSEALTEQADADNEPYASETATAAEADKKAQDYMEVWDHYQSAFNAVAHRDSSDRHFKTITELCEAILGRPIAWESLSGMEIVEMIGIAKNERRMLEQRILSNVQIIMHLKAVINSIGKGRS